MKELKNSKIYFDNPGNIYKSGECLTGHVEINLNSSKTVTEVCIIISGEASVKWSENDSTKTSIVYPTIYTNKEQYIKEEICVIGGEIDLSVGHHIYPFKYLLPLNLPPSFGSKNSVGKIIYKVTFILIRHWKSNKYVEEPFIVEASTIQEYPQFKIPLIMTMEKQFGLIFKSKPLIVTAKTPQSGFRAGEIINVTIDVDNRSDTTVRCIFVKLREVSIFYATKKTQTDMKTISKNLITNEVEPYTTTAFNHTLTVPTNLVLQDLSNCTIIDFRYEITVKVCTGGLTRDLVGTMTMIPIK